MMDYLSEQFAPGPLFGWMCAIAVALIPLTWWRARSRKRTPTIRFSTVAPLRAIGRSWATKTRFVLPLLRILAIAALIVALARPQSVGAYRDINEVIAIQMVLDVSGSMSAEDFVIDGRPARRLDAVKQVFEEFVLGKNALQGRDGDLIGMTTFAMYTDTPCPLTLDHGSLIDLLRATEIPGWVEGRQVREEEEAGYTSLGDAVVAATDVLRRAGEQAVAGVPGAEAAKSRVMILLTDGADNPPEWTRRTSPNPVTAAEVAATLGIKIYTIGAVGSGRARRRSFFSRTAQVDEKTLTAIADATGGKYFRATDAESLATVYEEIGALEQRRTGERTFRDNLYAAKLSMLAALAALLFEVFLVNTRYRKLP